MRFIVTGGAGFIGSHLVDALIGDGHQVTVIDDLSSGRRQNVNPAARLVQAGIADAVLVADLARGADGIFHLAARVSVQDCIDNWLAGHADNLVGTIHVLDAGRVAGCPVVYASSAAVYGDFSGRICDEAAQPAPISPYGADKLAAEHQARAFAAIHGVPSLGLRLFNVYGVRQDPASPYAGVISRFVDNARQGRTHMIFGDGRQSRDFIEVTDVVTGLLAAMDHLHKTAGAEVRTGAARADIVNLCTGRATTLLDLVAVIDAAAGRAEPGRVRHAPARVGDIRHSLGATARMHRVLGPVARVPLALGIARLLGDADARAQPPAPGGGRR